MQEQNPQEQISIDELNERMFELKKEIDNKVSLYNTLFKMRQVLTNIIAEKQSIKIPKVETANE
jgi:hypothetical protein